VKVGSDNHGLHAGGQRVNAGGHKHAAAGHCGAERVVEGPDVFVAHAPPTGLPLVACRAKSPLMHLPTHTIHHPDIEKRAVHRIAHGGPQRTPHIASSNSRRSLQDARVPTVDSVDDPPAGSISSRCRVKVQGRMTGCASLPDLVWTRQLIRVQIRRAAESKRLR
jgi:hypothetical protein